MISRNNGGPVFPILHNGKGINLRDYFASSALSTFQPANTPEEAAYMAKWSYIIADAMLSERSI